VPHLVFRNYNLRYSKHWNNHAFICTRITYVRTYSGPLLSLCTQDLLIYIATRAGFLSNFPCNIMSIIWWSRVVGGVWGGYSSIEVDKWLCLAKHWISDWNSHNSLIHSKSLLARDGSSLAPHNACFNKAFLWPHRPLGLIKILL